jgi:cyclomaltodextrinase / maltogenic alpha-amylase / neopullulanase
MKRLASLFLALLVWSLVVACAPAAPRREVSPAHETSRAESLLDLEAVDADVWAWDVFVSGKRVGSAALEHCAIVVNGERWLAEITGGRFSAWVRLAPGENALTVECLTDRGELRSAVVRYNQRLLDRPKAQARARLDAGTVVLDGTASQPGEYARAPLARWQWMSRADLAHTSEHPIGEGATVAIAAPTTGGTHHYRLRVTDVRGQSDEAGAVVSVIGRDATIRAESDARSFLDEAIVYGVIPPLHGQPPLRAAASALDAIAALGVTVVWLSPVFGTLPGDFGYAVTDYEHVRPDYGTSEDLRAFMAAAHGRNLRVIFDVALNHTSKEHPYFRRADKLGVRSHYFDFYDRDTGGRPTHYFDWEHLPNLHYQNVEVGRWMTEISLQWVRAFGADGYRVDAAWGVARRRPEFWPQWSAELRRMNPELLLVAEASAREPYYLTHGFDVAYDWTEELGQWAWKDVFAAQEGIVQRLHDAVTRTAQAAPRPDRVLRFLNNNDTGARFISRYGEDMTRVATAALLTLPGVPCLYDFDDVGGEFEPYAGLRPVRLKPRAALRGWHEQLIRLRGTSRALRGPGFFPLLVDAQREVYAYVRHARADDAVLVVLHFGAAPVSFQLAVPELWSGPGATARDLLTNRSFTIRRGQLDLTMAGWETLILVKPREGKNPRSASERGMRNSRSLASAAHAGPFR